MTLIHAIADLRAALDRDAGAGRTRVGFVPTMGALHEGHLSLIRAARISCDPVVVSVFVNPTQFNDAADLAAYPRQESEDARMAARAGADYVFAPPADAIYPAGDDTIVEVGAAAAGFEGDFRPGHFRGVATVCTKLFAIVRPAMAFFGQKDAQQVAVIQQLVRDLHLGLDVRVIPTMRDADGLAMSSRNARLSAADRQQALAIPRALTAGLDAYAGRANAREAAHAARAVLEAAHLPVEYCSIAHFGGGPTLVVAARAGRTRLIDNVPLDDPARAGLAQPARVSTGVRLA
jgi:pantoate--beta-alanine ligase